MMEDLRVYRLDEVKDILQVTRRTVYRYIKEGKLRAVKPGKYWLVRADELDRFTSPDNINVR